MNPIEPKTEFGKWVQAVTWEVGTLNPRFMAHIKYDEVMEYANHNDHQNSN